jgi:hypothetical protein
MIELGNKVEAQHLRRNAYLYVRQPVVSQGLGGLLAALLEALWQNPKARLPLLAVRRNSGRVFGLNVVAEANFNAIFDQWNRQHRNDIL